MAAVVFYVSGHGFGHASRQIEVINALGELAPAAAIVVRTSAARWLFDRTVRPAFELLTGVADTGVVQIDSLRLDEQATVARAAGFHRQLPELARAEAEMLRARGARLVIADAPALACAAASAAGIPSIVLSNFTWDWIYEGYDSVASEAPDLIPILRRAYAEAEAGWRLPLGGGFAAVPNVTDLPFVARHARHDGARVRHALGLPPGRPLALSSFGGYGVRDLDVARLDCLDDYGVVITGLERPEALPRGVHFVAEPRLYEAGLRYEDLVAAVDVVVTKPGYGIIAECVANSTAMLYTSRGRFAEYDVMVARMPEILRCGYIEQDALLAGRWLGALDAVLALPPPPERPATDGATAAARMIRDYL